MNFQLLYLVWFLVTCQWAVHNRGGVSDLYNQSGRWWGVCSWPFSFNHAALGRLLRAPISLFCRSRPPGSPSPYLYFNKTWYQMKMFVLFKSGIQLILLISDWVCRVIIGVYFFDGDIILSQQVQSITRFFTYLHISVTVAPKNHNFYKCVGFFFNQIRQLRCIDILIRNKLVWT